jgi:hypothetical protein
MAAIQGLVYIAKMCLTEASSMLKVWAVKFVPFMVLARETHVKEF